MDLMPEYSKSILELVLTQFSVPLYWAYMFHISLVPGSPELDTICQICLTSAE